VPAIALTPPTRLRGDRSRGRKKRRRNAFYVMTPAGRETFSCSSQGKQLRGTEKGKRKKPRLRKEGGEKTSEIRELKSASGRKKRSAFGPPKEKKRK